MSSVFCTKIVAILKAWGQERLLIHTPFIISLPYSDWTFIVSLRLGVGGWGGEEVQKTPPVTVLQLKLLRRYFDNSEFMRSSFNFHLVSNDMTLYEVPIT